MNEGAGVIRSRFHVWYPSVNLFSLTCTVRATRPMVTKSVSDPLPYSRTYFAMSHTHNGDTRDSFKYARLHS